jgi:hypothetical protein
MEMVSLNYILWLLLPKRFFKGFLPYVASWPNPLNTKRNRPFSKSLQLAEIIVDQNELKEMYAHLFVLIR